MAARADQQLALTAVEVEFLWDFVYQAPLPACLTYNEAGQSILLELGADRITEVLQDAGFTIRHSMD